MNSKRRKFLKNGLILTAGTIIAPSLFNDRIQAQPLADSIVRPEIESWENGRISVAWIGHSTVLINFFGKWILTDPVLFERVGIYMLGTSVGPSRLTPPALSIDEIPKPDIILLSHAHMDHMDYPTLSYLTDKYPGQIAAVTAYLTADVIEDLEWKSITVLDWGQDAEIDSIKFKAHEVEHFGWRFPWEKDRSRGYFKDGRSYNSYLIEYKGRRIFFGGDTAYSDKLQKIGNGGIDIALMPVGAYNPWRRAHCNPEEALEMASWINAEYFVPIHCMTFAQGNEPFEEPISWVKESIDKYQLKLGLSGIGETFQIS